MVLRNGIFFSNATSKKKIGQMGNGSKGQFLWRNFGLKLQLYFFLSLVMDRNPQALDCWTFCFDNGSYNILRQLLPSVIVLEILTVKSALAP